MCQQCTTNALNYGQVIPGWYLMRAQQDGTTWKAGQWGLVLSNDPTFTWTSTPTANPAFGLDDAAEEALYESNKDNEIGARIVSTDLPEDFVAAFSKMAPRTGYELVVAAMKRGYHPRKSGDLHWWLFDWIGEYLKTAQPRHHGNHDAMLDLSFDEVHGPATLPAGKLLYGDLAEILSEVTVPQHYNGAVVLTLNGKIVGIVGRSIDQPSGWSCVVSADIVGESDASVIMVPQGASAKVSVVEIAERGEPLPCPEHDCIVVRVNSEELLALC